MLYELLISTYLLDIELFKSYPHTPSLLALSCGPGWRRRDCLAMGWVLVFVVAGLGCGRTLALDRKLKEVPEHPPAASCPGAHEPGYDALQNLRAALKAENKTSDRALVIGPGEGTTATRTLAHILKDAFGLRVLHWHLFDREGSKKHAADALLHELARVPPAEYHQIDWISLMEPFDAVLDTPIPNIFPFLYAAFPNARIVHTVRAADEWVHTRGKRAKPGTCSIW